MIKAAVPIVPVSKLEPTIALLEGVGFKVNWIHDPGGNLRYASLSIGNVEVHLSESRGDGVGPVACYFWSDDVDSLANLVGVSAENQTWGTREFWLRDADGNSFRFGQRLD
jgi:uncharacterized glyoxalase superfamily protein PhnB